MATIIKTGLRLVGNRKQTASPSYIQYIYIYKTSELLPVITTTVSRRHLSLKRNCMLLLGRLDITTFYVVFLGKTVSKKSPLSVNSMLLISADGDGQTQDESPVGLLSRVGDSSGSMVNMGAASHNAKGC